MVMRSRARRREEGTLDESTVGKDYDVNSYFEWVLHERECQGTYHNHKETMAWVATALYIPGVMALGYYASRIDGWFQSFPLWVPFIVLAVLVSLFVEIQFRNRWKAAETVAGLIRVAGQLLTGEISLNDSNVRTKPNKRWPKFIEDGIEAAAKSEANRLCFDKMATMGVSFLAIVLATLFACLVASGQSCGC